MKQRLQWFYCVIGRQRHTSTLESWTSIVTMFAYFTWFAAGSEIGHSCRPIYLLEANRVRITLPFPSIRLYEKFFTIIIFDRTNDFDLFIFFSFISIVRSRQFYFVFANQSRYRKCETVTWLHANISSVFNLMKFNFPDV